MLSIIAYSLSASSLKCLKNTLPNTTAAPAHVVRMDDPEIPEPLGQIPPRDTGTIPIQDSLDKEPIIPRGATPVSGFPRNKTFDPLPLIIP